jgi:voltage-gated potassium channel
VADEEVSRVERWEHRAEVPLVLLALAFLVAYAWQVLDPNLDDSLEHGLTLTSWTVWAAFAVDFVVRVWLADHRTTYVVRHWYDVVLIGLPVLRPLRLLRLLAFSRILNRSAVGNLAGRVVVYVSGAAISAVLLASLAVLQAERGAPGSNIESFDDALWWSWCTSTTVGYGDFYPVTATGRCIGVSLMLVGIAMVSAFTAAIAAWIVGTVERESRAVSADAIAPWSTRVAAEPPVTSPRSAAGRPAGGSGSHRKTDDVQDGAP